MTEQNPYEKEVLSLLKTIADQTKRREDSSKPSTEPQGHKTHETIEDILACPECYPEIKKGVIEKEFKDADFECEKCGLNVKGEESAKEDWECPSCHHKYAKPKR